MIIRPKTGRYFSLHLRLILAFVPALVSHAQNSVIATAPDEIAPIIAPFDMPQLRRPTFPARSFDIREFGAKGDGQTKNTSAIQHAIDAATKAGGGRVLVPEGRWLTGAIHLENNVDLHLVKNSELLFSQDPNDYLPAVFSRHEDTECYKFSAFIYAEGKINIAITGEGTLNGQGKPWWEWKTAKKSSEEKLVKMANSDVPVKERVFDGKKDNVLRPAFFQPMSCQNILVEGVTFLYGAFWTITPTYCENVIVRKVKIKTDGEYGHTPNGDGVDPSSSRNVLIEYCEFDTGDDCIAIKAGRDRDGLRVDRPTENIVVRHCIGLKGHGGIVIGSETSGGIRNIYAFDCRFNGTDRIVRVKTARGRGGILENMWFRDLSADTIQQEALHINMLYTGTRLPAGKVTKSTPRIRNLHYSNISCSFGKKAAIEILGIPEMPVEDISFDSISIVSALGIVCSDAVNIQLRNTSIVPKSGPLVKILDSEKVTVEALTVPEGTDTVIDVNGPKSNGIVLSKTNTSRAKTVVHYGEKVQQGAVTVQ